MLPLLTVADEGRTLNQYHNVRVRLAFLTAQVLVTSSPVRMSFSAMKESLELLTTLLKSLDMLGDPKKDISVSAQSPVTTQFADFIPLIESSQQAILDLSKSLCDAIQRYLTVVNSSISSRRRTVALLPNELMIQIFQVLVVDGSHHLQPLLLVNKRFHVLVTTAPSLWCNINIKFDEALQECNNLSVRYIRSCIKYSGKSFLNIDLDLADISDTSGCAVSILEIVKKEVPRFSDVIGFAIDIAGELDGLDEEAFFTRRLDKLDSLVKALAGKKGFHARRWRSLKLSTSEPDYHASDKLWPLLKYKMPNLKTFVLRGSLSEEFDDFDTFDDDIPNLTAVRHLTLSNTSEFRLASFSLHLLTTVVVSCLSHLSGLDIFSSCRALQELTITDVERYLEDWRSEKSPIDVELPSLKKLALGGSVGALKDVKFRTPCLNNVTLFCGCEEGLPKLRARSMVWAPDADEVESLELTTAFLKYLIGDVKEMEELVFVCPEEEMAGIVGQAVREVATRWEGTVVETRMVIRIILDDATLDVVQIGND
ncbi:hypothetical protein FRC17_008116 [Serendipita sp. 399]|nr:hypothetical protein FRC17_008116 [Serendipita sp. 399]